MKREINLARRLKVLGISVMATLALGTALASAAQAKGIFGAEQYPASVKGTPTNELTFSGGTRSGTCGGSFGAVLTAASGALEVTPQYANCKTTSGSWPVSVVPNGCTYSWSINTVSGGTEGTGTETIACPAGKELTISLYDGKSQQEEGIARCAWGIAPQGPLSGIGYTNLGSGKTAHIEAATNIGGIKATVLKGTKTQCGADLGGTTSFNLSGKIDLVASNVGSEQVGLSFSAGGVYMNGEASADPAKQPRIESEWGAANVPVAGDQSAANPHQLKFGGVRSVSCGGARLAGELPASKLLLSAEYTNCVSMPASLSTTIDMNSCDYRLNVLNVGPPYAGSMDVTCLIPGDGIEVSVLNESKTKVNCLYKIGPQSGLTSIGLETVGSGIHRGVAMNLGLSGTVTVLTGTKLLCGGAPGSSTFTYQGGTTLFAQ